MYRSLSVIFIVLYSISLSVMANVDALLPNYFSGAGFKPDRAYAGETVNENIDTNTGLLILNHSDLIVPGGNGLEIRIQRTYSSSVLNSRSVSGAGAPASAPYPSRFLNSRSPYGLGWTMHMGRVSLSGQTGLVNICDKSPTVLDDTLLNNAVLELPDGSQRPLLVSVGSSKGALYSYDFQTRDERWSADCINNGDGLRVYGPNGVQYEMTYRISSAATQYTTQQINTWYPVKIRTPYGDYLNITYKGQIDNNALISSITRKDGAKVDFTYKNLKGGSGTINSTTHLSRIRFQGKTWNYTYKSITQNNTDTRVQLTKVTGPEGLVWQYSYYPLKSLKANQTLLQTITYPYGGQTDYTYKYVDFWGPNNVLPIQDKFFSIALATKKTSGPGVSPGTWTYSYSPGSPFNTTTVVGPAGKTTYKYSGGQATGNINFIPDFKSDGLLAERSEYDKSNNLIFRESNYYGTRGTPSSSTSIGKFLSGTGSIVSNERDTHPVYYDGANANTWDGDVLKKHLARKHTWVDGTVYKTGYGLFGNGFQPGRTFEVGQASRVRDIAYCKGSSIKIHNWDYVTSEKIDGVLRSESKCDKYGRKISEYADGVRTTYKYSSSSSKTANPIEKTDALGNRWKYSSYKFGIPQTITLPDLSTITRKVSNEGEVTSETDQNGNTTTYVYDDLSRVVSLTLPKGQSQSYGQVISVSRSFSTRKTTYTRSSIRFEVEYNGFGQPIRVDENGTVRYMRYDALGRKVFESYPGKSTTGVYYSYDQIDRILTKRLSSGEKVSYSYLSGNRTKVTDENGNTITLYYRSYGNIDADRSLIKVVYPEGITLSIKRNGMSRITEILVSGSGSTGFKRNFTYSSKNKTFLLKETHPETTDVSYLRNALGDATRRMQQRKPASSVTEDILYSYDALSRLTSKKYVNASGSDVPVGSSTLYKYDAKGNLISVTRGLVSKKYSYDKNDNLVREDHTLDGKLFTVSYKYNSLDQLHAITYPSGRVVTYSPDSLGRPTQASGFVNNVDYFRNSIISRIDFANGTVFQASLNTRQQPDLFRVSNPNGSTDVMNLQYFYDSSSNLSSIIDSVDSKGSKSFQYDGVHRLVSAVGPWGNGAISYDAIGNITGKAIGGESIQYYYDSLNKLSKTTGSLQESYSSDIYGNIVSAGSGQYGYDRENNLTSYTGGKVTVKYFYDGNNRLAYKDKNSQRDYFIYTKAGLYLGKYNKSLSNIEEYIYIGSRQVAKARQGTPPVANAGPDQTVGGSMAVILDASGSTDDGQIVGYQWTQVAGPAVVLSSANKKIVTLTSPDVTAAVVLQFRLTVTDDGGDVNSDLVSITVTPATVSPASIKTPVPGASLSATPVTFTWGAASAGAWKYQLWIGTQPGWANLYKGDISLSQKSATVSLTFTGKPIYVRLRTRFKQGWGQRDYVYQTQRLPVEIISPANGSTLAASPVTFTWGVAPAGVKKFQLWVGTKPGWANLLKKNINAGQTGTNVSLSFTGAPVYVRFRTRFKEGWVEKDYVYQTVRQPVEIISPVAGSILKRRIAVFTWQKAPAGTKKFQLWVGTKPGWANVFKRDFTPAQTSTEVPITPNDAPLYVRFRSRFKEGWLQKDYIYQTSTAGDK